MHIYAFGSLCRGEITRSSDVDLLAITDGADQRFDEKKFSIYSYPRIEQLWVTGNAFAWHLALESSLIYADNDKDFLKTLGKPAPYANCVEDCRRFATLFRTSVQTLRTGSNSQVFELAAVFLSIRNIASCYSLGILGEANFARAAARQLGDRSVPISDGAYLVLERARILSTRGTGEPINAPDVDCVLKELDEVAGWVNSITREVEGHG